MVTDEELHRLRAAVEAALPDYLADLELLVNIDCGSYTKAGVDQVGRWLADQLAELGAAITIEASSELGDTVVAELEGRGGPRALMIGHLDTVFAEGTVAARPFAMREGRAYGPGVERHEGRPARRPVRPARPACAPRLRRPAGAAGCRSAG